jgi:hypothetical protein
MGKRFLQTEYEKLPRKELIKAIYTIGDKADLIYAQNATNIAMLRESRAKLRMLKERNRKLNQTARDLRQRVADLTKPVAHPL